MNVPKSTGLFTYRRLNNLFEFNRKHVHQQSDNAPIQPNVTVEYAPSQKSSLIGDMVETTVGAIGNLFTLGPASTRRNRRSRTKSRKRTKRKRKSRKNLNMSKLYDNVKKQRRAD